MHARVTTFQIRPGQTDQVAQILADAANEIRDLPGFREGILLIDRQQSHGMTITLWDSQQAIDDSAAAARQLFGRAATLFDGQPTPHSYAVVAHRAGDANRKLARVSTGTQTAAAAEQAAAATGESPIIAAASRQPGYAGFLSLIDPASRRLVGMSFWDSQEHLQASEGGYYTQQMSQSRDLWEGGQWTRAVYEVAAVV